MAHLDNLLFPIGIKVGAVGGTTTDVTVVVMANRQESRNQSAAYNLWQGDCSLGAKLPAVWKPLRAFFMIADGKANTFRYRDPLDNTCTTAEGVFIAIDSTHAQLAKRYSNSGYFYDRPIQCPVHASFVPTGGSGLSLDYATGILTFATLPSTFACGVHLKVRFDTNEMRAEAVDHHPTLGLVVDWNSIPMTEVRGS